MIIRPVENFKDNKITLAHDSFTQMGGAERVVKVLTELFESAPMVTLVAAEEVKINFPNTQFHTSFLQSLYTVYPHFQHLLPLIPAALKTLKLPENKIILSSSSAFIKGIYPDKNTVHINYCHTPTRFLWTDSQYITQEVPFVLRPFAKLFLSWLKGWDVRAAGRVHAFIANSQEVQKRIKQFYNRDSVVIYPSVDTDFWHKTQSTQSHFLLVGRLHAHKHNNLIIEVCNTLQLPLRIVGMGRNLEELKALAGPTITFLGRISDEALRDEYSSARAVFFPQLEDFGLIPVEAASCGTPTIALGKGGALETIQSGVTGVFFKEASLEELRVALEIFETIKFNPEVIRAHARQFSHERFKKQITDFLTTVS